MDMTEETQTQEMFPLPIAVYHSPVDAMHHYGSLFIIMCLRYLRKNPERMINDAGGYSPRSVSLTELIQTVTQQNSEAAEKWLETRKLPTLEQCDELIASYREYIRRCNETTFETAEAQLGSIPVEQLRENFQLSTLEIYIVLVCALIQMDERYANAWRYVTGASEREMPSVSFVLGLLGFLSEDSNEIYRCLRPDSTLVRYALVELMNNPSWGKESPVAYSYIKVPRRILSYLLGDSDAYMPPAGHLILTSENGAIAGIDKSVEKNLQRCLQKPCVRIGLMGTYGMGRTDALVHCASHSDLAVIRVKLGELYDVLHGTEVTPMVYFSEIFREMRLRRAVLCIDTDHLSSEAQAWFSGYAAQIRQLFERETHLKLGVLLARQTTFSRSIFGELTEIAFPQPSREMQPKLWTQALCQYLPEESAREIAESMSVGYCLSAHEIQATIDQTLSRKLTMPLNRVITPEHLSETLNKTRGHGLEGLATLRSTSLMLKDLVLSGEIRKVLDEIICYAKYSEAVMQDWGFAKYNVSGAGLSVLLSGGPGTGKTLTALVLANELGRAIYVVDLSRVVDKYVGETEKKLSQIFDEAEKSQAMLLFDEADSLFAKRTDVKSSNDRYANLEVNYLLQRLEAYRGVTILTTNLAGGLDEALARRIQFKIEYPLPDVNQRLELWKRLIPPKAPCDKDLELMSIARYFEMSGGHIKNAIFRASIQAISGGGVLTKKLLWDAAVHEYRSMGHIIRDKGSDETDYH